MDNSGCSFEFRYLESRHDVSVLNHTRVHLTFKDKVRRPPPRAYRAPPRHAHHRAPPRAVPALSFLRRAPQLFVRAAAPEHAAPMRTRPRTRHPAHRHTGHRRGSSCDGGRPLCFQPPSPPSRALPPRAFLSRLQTLKLRLQQTALGERGEWLDCFEMKAP